MTTARRQRLIQLALATVFLVPLAGFLLLFHLHPAMAGRGPAPEPGPDTGGLRVTWLGGGSVYVTDGETALLTDPFFSRPSVGRVLFGALRPEPGRIRSVLQRAEIGRLDAVIPLHSHYDHMLDAPWLAEHFGALFIGARSAANVARGAGLNEALIREVEAGQTRRLGKFRLTFVHESHVPMAPLLERITGRGESVEHPFPLPARFTAWRQGRVLALMVRHPRGSLLIHTSAGFVPGALKDREGVDLALVSTALLSRQNESFRQKWFREVVAASDPKMVIPVHWDDPFSEVSPETPAMPWFLDNAPGSVDALREPAKRAGIAVRLLSPLQSLSLDAAAPRPGAGPATEPESESGGS